MTFTTWMKLLDYYVEKASRCSVYDLADADYISMWEDETPPKEAADEILLDNGFTF